MLILDHLSTTPSKRHVLILEGPRCAGKTFVADHLVKCLGWRRIKAQRGENPWYDMHNTLDEVLCSNENIVIDRFHFTEYVLSLFYQRNEAAFLEGAVRAVDNKIKLATRYCAIDVIILNPYARIIEERLKERPEDRQADMPPGIAYLVWNSVSTIFGWPIVHLGDDPLETILRKYTT